MSIDISQFYQVFFEEAAEHLASMESLLLGLNVAEPSDDDLNAIFRAAHSIKGGAGTFGFHDMVEVTHVLENLLDKLRKHELQLTDEMVNVFLEAGDVIHMQLSAHRGEGHVEPIEVKMACDKLAELNRQGTAQPTSAVPETVVGEEPAFGFFEDEPSQVQPAMDDAYGFFVDAPEASTTISPTPIILSEEDYGFFTEVEELPAQVTARQEAKQGYGFFKKLKPQPAVQDSSAETQNPGRRATDTADEAEQVGRRSSDKAVPAADTSIRVNVEKVDQLINLIGELVITQAMLAQSASGMDDAMYEKMQ
ncbi:MAG: Hpt domain-containing protein, partial [Pseudomonadota bacterium]